MTTQTTTEFGQLWDDAVTALYRVNNPNQPPTPKRDWFIRLHKEFNIHPVIKTIVYTHGVRPKDWQQLLLEWPHVSCDDNKMLAYSRDERAGEDFPSNGSARQTKTTLGKYLARHWPHMADHVRRDWASLFTPDNLFIVTDHKEMIYYQEQGPQSCMVSRYGEIPFDKAENVQMCKWWADKDNEDQPNWEYHPYIVYNPVYGWSMCVHEGQGMVLGRALLWTNPDDDTQKIFVRTYIRGCSDGSRSETDTAMEAWLRAQGYLKRGSWPEGAKFDRVEHPTREGFMMPYLDGDCDGRRVANRGAYIIRSDSGDYECASMDGTATYDEAEEAIGMCECCEDPVMEDDSYERVGRHGDTMVCFSCARHNYTLVRGAGGETRSYDYHTQYRTQYRTYYLPDDDARVVARSDYSIDPNNLPEGVVELESGDYAELDDCVDIEDEWYLADDEALVNVVEEHPDTGSTLALMDDCWLDGDGYRHRDSIEHVEVDGEKYTVERATEMLEA